MFLNSRLKLWSLKREFRLGAIPCATKMEERCENMVVQNNKPKTRRAKVDLFTLFIEVCFVESFCNAFINIGIAKNPELGYLNGYPGASALKRALFSNFYSDSFPDFPLKYYTLFFSKTAKPFSTRSRPLL